MIGASAAAIDLFIDNKANAAIPSPDLGPVIPTTPPIVFMYHDINFPNPANLDEQGNWVPPENFRRQIELAQALGYKIGTVSEALQRPSEILALTFDDGLHTVYDLIFPYLQLKDIKATFFVPVDALLSNNPYYAEPEQIREMADAGNEVGSHSFDHTPLTAWNTQMVRTELRRSKEFLEDLIGKEVTLFAYPNGKHNRHIAEEVLITGYRAAFLSRRNTQVGFKPPLDRFELPRHWITAKTDTSQILSSRK